ncbi:MAG TPA: hypothetical protein VLW50_22400 [Streptosporangiaceae bacterium]|nr:hypothetical protein [Streptosporangiaceae bacterium]
MTGVATAASVRFSGGHVPTVDSAVRPTCRTFIDCHVYEDCAPILVIQDVQVSVSVTVPDSGQVTEEDLICGRALAEAAARYAAELERRVAQTRESEEASSAASGTVA